MPVEKIWSIPHIPHEEVEQFASTANLPYMLASILHRRGITDLKTVHQFLHPQLQDLQDPFLLTDMHKATDRIVQAINAKETILIFGDYDVDGITSTSLVTHFLKSLDADVHYFIPDRVKHGYGFTFSALSDALQCNPSLVITVDCGIVSFDEVLFLQKKSIDVIITDHHECKDTVPEALAAINPHRKSDVYPFKDLAGVGVAFKLVTALCEKLSLRDRYLSYLDLVCVGTIADVMPLVGENRILVHHGISTIHQSKNLGLLALIETCDLTPEQVHSQSIAFMVAPRLNAAGRIGDAKRGVELFLSHHPLEVQELAKELHTENKNRQAIENEILEKALFQIESDPQYLKEPVLVVYGKNWHHGVIGIVASRITERYYKPSFVISFDDETAKGSGRSISAFNLYESLCHVSAILQKFGGHKMAAGLSLSPENIENFRKEINIFANTVLTAKDLTPKLFFDAQLQAQDITQEAISSLSLLEPFGAKNPKPLFCVKDFSIHSLRAVGNDKHLKLAFSQEHYLFDGIAFGMGNLQDELKQGDRMDVAFFPELNVWNQQTKIQFNVKDLKKNPIKRLRSAYYKSLHRLFKDYPSTASASNEFSALPVLPCLETHLKSNTHNLLLTNSFSATRSILEIFQRIGFVEHQDYAVFFGEVSISTALPNILLINPSYQKISLDTHENILLIGSLFSLESLKGLLSKQSTNVFHVPHNDSSPAVQDFQIERKDIESVYRYLKMPGHRKIYLSDPSNICEEITKKFSVPLNPFKLVKIFEILDQLSISRCSFDEKHAMILEFTEPQQKKELTESSIYNYFSQLPFTHASTANT